MENVGCCPTPEVMDVLHRHLPGYECAAFRLNAADFGSLTWRYRLHIVAVLRKSLVVADMSRWLAFLEQCRVPRQDASEEGLQACLLDCSSPEITACASVVRLPPPSPGRGDPATTQIPTTPFTRRCHATPIVLVLRQGLEGLVDQVPQGKTCTAAPLLPCRSQESRESPCESSPATFG